MKDFTEENFNRLLRENELLTEHFKLENELKQKELEHQCKYLELCEKFEILNQKTNKLEQRCKELEQKVSSNEPTTSEYSSFYSIDDLTIENSPLPDDSSALFYSFDYQDIGFLPDDQVLGNSDNSI